MQPQEWQKIKDVFIAALDQPVELRSQFVAEACGTDERARAEVESLLSAHEEPKNLLEKHTINLAEKLLTPAQTYVGKRFGSYRILKEIGRGGMGSVFLAERADGEFEQQVALKIIRRSFGDDELEKHFRRERQILASLSHPDIARLVDGGVSETGELFLAMEFVDGKTLISFAEDNGLTIEQRLRLFLKICRAVSFAHQNLIIHRDLKPSNILVTDDGEPKLLDFGLAKLSEPVAQPESADLTETGFRAFTPAYASPEQILGKRVTTASDVFSLGVILYELLTNDKPFHFEGKSIDEIIKTVTGASPSLPSRLTNSQNPQSQIRRRQLQGDLDNITLKALEKDPARRYQSVAEFADDIERHLDHLPVIARPNTLAYRASRFYKRNKIAVSAAALVVAALIIGLGIALWQNHKARRENARAAAVNSFLQQMLTTTNSQSRKSDQQGYQRTVEDFLQQAERRLEGEELSNEPEVRAELREAIGTSYLDVGNYPAAEKNLRQALTEQSAIYGNGSPKLLKTEFSLATLSFARGDYESAEKIYQERLSLLRTETQQGRIPTEFFVLRLSDYALLRRARGDSIQAETFLRESLALSIQASFNSEVDMIEGFLTLILLDRGKFAEAETLQESLVTKYREQGKAETPEFCAALTLLGSILMEQGKLNEAEASLREGESLYRKVFGPNYTPIYDNLRLQAQVSYLEGKYRQADTQVKQVMQNYRQNSNPKYISFATGLTVQGLILDKLNRAGEAEKILREALQLRQSNLPEKHFMTALTKGALGECLTLQKKFAEAEPLLLESHESLTSSQGTQNPRTVLARNRLVELYQEWNKPDLVAKYRSEQ